MGLWDTIRDEFLRPWRRDISKHRESLGRGLKDWRILVLILVVVILTAVVVVWTGWEDFF
jgi:hypothetical protein